MTSMNRWVPKVDIRGSRNFFRGVQAYFTVVVQCFILRKTIIFQGSRGANLLIFSKLTFFKNSFKNTIRVSNGLYPDQNRRSVGTELGANYLQRLSVDKKEWET